MSFTRVAHALRAWDESFGKLENSLAHKKGVHNPAALAAYIGREHGKIPGKDDWSPEARAAAAEARKRGGGAAHKAHESLTKRGWQESRGVPGSYSHPSRHPREAITVGQNKGDWQHTKGNRKLAFAHPEHPAPHATLEEHLQTIHKETKK